MSGGKTLVGKLAEVMAEVERVAKNGRNDFHKYDYATEADILSAVREHMASRSLILVPSVTNVAWRAREDKDPICTMTVDFRVLDGDSPDALTFTVIGEGQDKGDKATYKAMTGATKYALLKLFLIPTGDDPEIEDAAPKSRRQRPDARRVSADGEMGPGPIGEVAPFGYEPPREPQPIPATQTNVCPECGKPAIIKGKQEYGGGWVCFKKRDGCGVKFRDGDPRIEGAPAAPNLARGIEIAGSVDDVDDPEKHRAFMVKRIEEMLATMTKARATVLFRRHLSMEDPKGDYAKIDLAAIHALYTALGEAA